MGFYQTLKARGQAASDHYAGSRAYFDLTPASVSLLKVLDPVLRTVAAEKEHNRLAGSIHAYRRTFAVDLIPGPCVPFVDEDNV